jgi:transducin (beta)-like 1
MIATGGADATARIWEFDGTSSPSSKVMHLKESPIVMKHLPAEKGSKDVTGVAWHPDGMMLATCES